MNPQISVLLPVYNGRKYLQNTIKSILSQSFSSLELIVLDDGSTDGSAEILQKINDPRIRFYQHRQNLGISITRNKLIDLSRAEYLAVIDQDDLMPPERLLRQKQFLDQHPEIDVAGSWFRLVCQSEEKGLWGKLIKWFINLGWEWHHPMRPTLKDALRSCPLMHPSAMIRRSSLDRFGLRYREEFSPAEDYALWSEILLKGGRIANQKDILLLYNLHGENCSLIRKKQLKKADRKVKEFICRHLGIAPVYYPYRLVILAKLRFSRRKND